MKKIILPNLSDITTESIEERMVTFRRFFADIRLYRLHFQLTVLNYFSSMDNPDNQQFFNRQLEEFASNFKNMDGWLHELKSTGIYPEFRDQCLQEIKAIEQIIQSYEKKMNG